MINIFIILCFHSNVPVIRYVIGLLTQKTGNDKKVVACFEGK